MEIGVNMVRQEESERVKVKAEANAEERLLDLLLPPRKAGPTMPGMDTPAVEGGADSTREKFRRMWRDGKLDERTVEVEISVAGPQMSAMSMPGMEGMEMQVQDMFSKMFPKKKKTKKVKVKDAFELLVQEESEKLVDMERVQEIARERVQESGIVFIDEIDKVCGGQQGGKAEVSREGVQRDLLPVVEGSTVNTKYGMIKTDHILFIAAGAFHMSKPSDLVPELQGRFPLRVELGALNKDEFYRILTEPQNALTIQYAELLGTEGVTVEFAPDGLEEIALFAQQVNEETENIGARRLYTIMERILTELSFTAPERTGTRITVDREYVREQLGDVREDRDLSRYIL
jgi:ATP-dependent HslUV protease ATP-binding subunit HslU